jgi:hypothetical protein
MTQYEIERNDPCPCGTGRKYKKCNIQKCGSPSLRKFKAKVLSGGNSPFFSRPIHQAETALGLSTQDLAKRIRANG